MRNAAVGRVWEGSQERDSENDVTSLWEGTAEDAIVASPQALVTRDGSALGQLASGLSTWSAGSFLQAPWAHGCLPSNPATLATIPPARLEEEPRGYCIQRSPAPTSALPV